MEISLQTDGAVASLRIIGAVSGGETASLSEYLRVARENGAVKCLVDLTECTELPTTILPLLTREAAKLAEAGGALGLCGVRRQNPFLLQAVEAGKFPHFATLAEASMSEAFQPSRPPIDAPGAVP